MGRTSPMQRTDSPIPPGCDAPGRLPKRCWETQIFHNRCGPPDASPRALWPPATQKPACAAHGLAASPSFGSLRLAPAGLEPMPSSVQRRRVAVCITGQLRALPVAVLNWQQSLLKILRAGGLALDVFVVTSESRSFEAWRPFLESMRPVRVIALGPGYIFNRTSTFHEGWAVRNASGRIEFNLARFPWFGYYKYGTVLVQQYQMQLCRRIIAQQEHQTGVQYLRVARVRTDLIFSGLPIAWDALPGAPRGHPERRYHGNMSSGTISDCRLHGEAGAGPGTPWGDRTSAECATRLSTVRERIVQECESYLASVEERAESWLTGSDLWLFGSRDVMMGTYLRGLHILEQAKLHRPNESLRIENIRNVWNYVWAAWQASDGGSRQLHSGYACTAATADLDFVRASGSNRRFFLQLSESDRKLAPCLRQTTLIECMRAEEARWAVPFAVLSACVGFDYDIAPGWNRSCSAEDTASDLVRFHARSFGPDLVGDVTGWAKHKMATKSYAYENWVTVHGHVPSDGF
jgi:hypothetical protein